MEKLLNVMQEIKKNFSGYERKYYLEKIYKYFDTNLIKVLVGQRRVGKSYIMRSIINKLGSSYFDNIFYVNFEIDDFQEISKLDKLKDFFENYFLPNIDTNKKIYVFCDEIQELDGWEKFINSLLAKYSSNIEIFISGSNSNLLSGELSTYLSGRYIEFQIMPFSYFEYTDFTKSSDFLKYLSSTGLPEAIKLSALNDREIITNYIKTLKNTIVLKDIVGRYKIKDIFLLETLINFFIDNIGSLSSLNNITNKLIQTGVNTNHNTIGTYVYYLESVFLIYGVQRYDLKGKKILEMEKKYYLNDLGFKNYLNNNYDTFKGKHLENYVFCLLRKYGYDVYVGNIKNLEIDFVAKKSNQTLFIQVAFDLSSQEVYAREITPFFEVDDKSNFYLVTIDKKYNGNDRGINILDIESFEEELIKFIF